MSANIPEWASTKQREGMNYFYELATEYGSFDISFKQPEYYSEDDDSEFIAILTWGYNTDKDDLGIRTHEIRVAWNYEQYFDHCSSEVDAWQLYFLVGSITGKLKIKLMEPNVNGRKLLLKTISALWSK